MDEPTKQTDELITIAGGVEMEVKYQNNGAGETVKVRQIPISKIQSFIIAIGKEDELIEVYCDKPKGWADTLTLESANAIADKGQELNRFFFRAWFRRQMLWREDQQPGSTISEDKSPEAAAKEPSSVSASSPPQSPTTTT